MKWTIKSRTFFYRPARIALPAVAIAAAAGVYGESASANGVLRESFSRLAAIMNYSEVAESDNPEFGSKVVPLRCPFGKIFPWCTASRKTRPPRAAILP
jgi:hypothetical protein